MIFTDTRDNSVQTNLRTAVLQGMNSKTGGLYIPCEYPRLSKELLENTVPPTFREIAFEIAKVYCKEEISDAKLQQIISDCYPFNIPVTQVDPNSYVLELYHGPTCAFKDVGARFMAQLMSYFNEGENDNLHILVATSGDTGSAVGSAFHGLPGIDVTILYPKGKISEIQEKQLSTFTGNVRALAVEGTFDDCQKLVKQAFTDNDIRAKLRLSSANSINIARLLPQSFYYMYSSLVVKSKSWQNNKIEDPAIIMTVPSGNFGNLTSGLIATRMGAPITGFIAATNANKTIPDWLLSGKYDPRPSVATLANAMDVGAPSNFERMMAMYSHEEIKEMMASYWTDDKGTIEGIINHYEKTGCIIDPHGAIGWQAWQSVTKGGFLQLMSGFEGDATQPGLTPSLPSWAQSVVDNKAIGIVLGTAHPAKFNDTVKEAIGREPPLPDRLEKVLRLKDNSVQMNNDYAEFKAWLLATLSK